MHLQPRLPILAAATLLAGCFGSSEPAKAPTVDAAHTFDHGDESNTKEDAVDSKLTLQKDQWIKLTGHWYSTDDRDRVNIAVGDGVNAYEAQTWLIRKDKTEPEIFEGLLGMNVYPLTLIMKDAEGKVLTNQIKAASGGGGVLKPGTKAITVQIASNDPPDPSSFGDPPKLCCGSRWIVYLKGTHKKVDESKASSAGDGKARTPADGAEEKKPEGGKTKAE